VHGLVIGETPKNCLGKRGDPGGEERTRVEEKTSKRVGKNSRNTVTNYDKKTQV